MSEPSVSIEDRGAVRHIWLNRPGKRNAQNADMLRSLERAIADTAATPSVRVVVLGGVGSSFSSGHDTKEMVVNREYRENAMTAEGRLWQELNLFVRPVEALRDLPVPTICRVQGHCIAAALMLVAAADLVVAAEDARFASHVTRDMGAADVETLGIAWELGERRAKQLLWCDETLDAVAARDQGIVNWVVAPDRLDEKVEKVAEQLLSVPREALALSKISMRFMEDRRGRGDANSFQFLAHQLSHQTSDAEELLRERLSSSKGS